MKVQRNHPKIGLSGLAMAVLVVSFCSPVVTRGQQAGNSAEQSAAPVQTPQNSSPATDSYSSSLASEQNPAPSGAASMAAARDNGQAQATPGAPAAESQTPPQKPIGAAAAPGESAAGVTAARPAGAVIAPAKQRRVRAILIRVGLLVGAGVALGTVMALSHATPSQPQ
jgi:hypothetical protein